AASAGGLGKYPEKDNDYWTGRCLAGNEAARFVMRNETAVASVIPGLNSRSDFLPLPVPNLWHVLPVLGDVLPVLKELVADGLLRVGRFRAKLRHAVDHVLDEMEAVEVVQHHHVERRGGRAFFLVAAHVEVLVVGAAIREPMNQPRVTVEGEDDRFVTR